MSSKSVERLCGKDGHWGPGLPRCKGADDDDCEPDDNDDDDNDDDDFDYKPWHVLYLGHFLPRDPLTTSQCSVPLEMMIIGYEDDKDDYAYKNKC